MIYFIQLGDDGPVKIGRANDVEERLATLQTAHYETLSLIRTFDGGKWAEEWLHSRFSANRIRGEWFAFNEEMLTVIVPPRRDIPLPAKTPPADDSALIDALGGNSALMASFGLRNNAISMWRRRGIPWRYRPALANLANLQGVDVPRDFLEHDAEAA